MSPAEIFYQQIAEEMPEAKPSKMFGALCLKAPNGKAFAMFWNDYMVFKLRGESAEDALSLDGVDMFAPMDARVMNGWIQVPFHYAGRWLEFAEAALAYVRTIEK